MSALKKIWQDGKLVGVSIEEQSASELAPTQFEIEVLRIVNELQTAKDRIEELELSITGAMMVASQGLYLADNSDYFEDLWNVIEELATPEQLQVGAKDYRDLYDQLKASLPSPKKDSIKPDRRCDSCGTSTTVRCAEHDCPVFWKIKDSEPKKGSE